MVVTSTNTVSVTTTVSDLVTTSVITFVWTTVTGRTRVTTRTSVTVIGGPSTSTATVRVPPGPVMVRTTRTGMSFVFPCFVLITATVVV